jgi:SEC-C motif domain protein
MVAKALHCPCGRRDAQARALVFPQCCGRYIGHFDDTPAPDPKSLMRSRYTAFVRGDREYLLATWHADTRPPKLDFDAETKWLGLEVRDQRLTGPGQAEVQFVARCRAAGGRASRLHERSRFVQQQGRWFYVDGDML